MDDGRDPASVSAQPRFAILGPLQVRNGASDAVPLGGPRARELLALLLLRPNRTITSDHLVTALWGESPSDGAATTLRTHVAAVRRVLADAGVPDALSTRAGGYFLALEASDLDSEVFADLVQRGQEAMAIGDPARAADVLAEALALWRGDVLSDLGPPDFAEAAVARLEELRVVAEERSMAAALALGQHRQVVGHLQELVAAHPFHEQLCEHLMLALYRSGRQAEALSAYAETKQRLGDELGLDPSPSLRALETAVLRQDPVLLPEVDQPVPATPVAPPTQGALPKQPPDAVFAALRRSRMVGREASLTATRHAWQEARAGGRGLLAVSGPAGVGKSRLAAELSHLAADEGATVLVGRCDAALPYAALASALGNSGIAQRIIADAPTGVRARLHPLLPLDPIADIEDEGAGGSAQRQALARAVQWVVATLAADAPVLLVVEDAERLTEEESGLIAAVATHLPSRTLVAVCFRDPPGSRHQPLADLLGRGGIHEQTQLVSLGALTRDEVGDLVASMHGGAAAVSPRFVDELWRRTVGNPFFARELLRDLDPAEVRSGDVGDALPAGLRDVLRHRLGQLPAETRAAVSAAAVLGREVELNQLSRLLEEPDDRVVRALDPAVADGFLIEAGQLWAGGYAFPHDLMHEAVYAEIPLPRRQRLHQQAVDVLLGTRPTEPTEAEVIAAAGHALEAGPAADPAEAAALVDRAARLAATGFGFEVAVRLAEARLPLLERFASAAEQADALVGVARLRLRSGRGYDRVVELLERALATYQALQDDLAAGRVHSQLGGALVVPQPHMNVVRSLEHFAAAERLLPPSTDLFSLHRGRLSAAMHALDTAAMAAAADRCAQISQATSRPQLSVAAEWGRAWLALDLGQPTAALAHLEEAWTTARAHDDPLLGWAPANAGAMICTVYLLDPAEGRAWCRRGLGQPRFDQLAHQHDALADQLVLALATSGELEAAQRAAARLPQEAVARRLVGLLLGDWEQAATQWRSALDHDVSAGDRHDAVANARWLAEALILLGQEHQAAAVLHQGLEIAASAPQLPSEVWIRARLAGLAGTEPTQAASHLARCEEVLGSGGDWRGLVGEVALARAAVALRDTDVAGADAAAQEAVAVFASYRLPWRRAAALQVWSLALDAGGREDEAHARRDEAAALLEGIGAPQRWRTDTRRRSSTRAQRRLNT